MIYCKGKIALTAAEIVNKKLALLRKIAVYILNVFEEAADLSEFVLLFIVYPARSVRDTKLGKKALIARKDVILLSVIRLRRNGLLFSYSG